MSESVVDMRLCLLGTHVVITCLHAVITSCVDCDAAGFFLRTNR